MQLLQLSSFVLILLLSFLLSLVLDILALVLCITKCCFYCLCFAIYDVLLIILQSKLATSTFNHYLLLIDIAWYHLLQLPNLPTAIFYSLLQLIPVLDGVAAWTPAPSQKTVTLIWLGYFVLVLSGYYHIEDVDLLGQILVILFLLSRPLLFIFTVNLYFSIHVSQVAWRESQCLFKTLKK